MLCALRLFRPLNNVRSSLPTSIHRSIVLSRKLSSIPNGQAKTGAPTDISSWTKDQITGWLLSVQPLADATRQKWEKLEVDGRSLSGVTADLLMKECGVPFGTAFPIVSQIHKLLGLGQVGMQPAMPSRPQTLETKYLSGLICNHPELKRYLKEDPAVPVRLAMNDAKFKRVARDTALRTAVAAFACRLYQRTRGTEHDRQRNPMPATLTTTGGGKSFFFDALAALSKQDLDMIFGDLEEMKKILQTMRKGNEVVPVLPEIMKEMREILENTVAVTITYNGGSNRTTVDDHATKSLGLALRALHSYWLGPEVNGRGVSFSRFADVMKEQLGPLLSELTLKRAINCIAEHSGKGVLLLADELMKAEPTVLESAKEIGVCLDELPPSLFNAAITTLNIKVAIGELLSGRYFLWIPLLPATYSEALQLFQHVIDEEKQKPLSPKARASLAALEQCIADCNGHFRSLETLWGLWNWIKPQEPSYARLIRQLGCEMEDKYSALELPHVCAALRGVPVQYSVKVPGLPLTYGEYLAMGYFLNTISPTNTETTSNTSVDPGSVKSETMRKFVPRVSPLQLLLFAINYIDDPEQEEYPYAKVILSMLDLEPNFSWEQYELFHANWETLIRLVLCRGAEHTSTSWTIQQLYGAPKSPQILKGTKFVDNQPSFYLSKRSTDICEWPTYFPQVNTDAHPADTSLPAPEGLTGKTILPATNNPGFDIVGFENKRTDGVESEPIVICTQCRFSDPDASTKLDKGEVDKDRDHTVDQFRPYFRKGVKLDGLTIKKENLFLVVCAFRDTYANAITDLPQNTVVLNRDALKKLYTPSLASRPQFILPLKPGESTQPPDDVEVGKDAADPQV